MHRCIDTSIHDTLVLVTPLSKWKLDKTDENQVRQVLVGELAKISDKEEMKTLISMLLTDTEQLMIAKRIFAFVLIGQGLTDMEIARKLHFTRATVERLRGTYGHMEETDRPVAELVKKFESSEVLKELLKKFLLYASKAAFGRIPVKNPYT